MESAAIGDVLAYGIILIEVPGTLYSGPLSLQSLSHQIAHWICSRSDQSVFFRVQSRAAVAEIASNMRWWAPHCPPHIIARDPQDRQQLEDIVSYLDEVQNTFTPGGIAWDSKVFGNCVYTTTYMIRCLLLSRYLRRTSTLVTAVKKALSLVLTPSLAQSAAALLDDKTIPLPSPSTLSRFQLSIDDAWIHLQLQLRRWSTHIGFSVLGTSQVAWVQEIGLARAARLDWPMGPKRSLKAGDQVSARFCMVDSSEQCGTDWMITACTEVNGDMLIPLSEALDVLCERRRRCQEEDEDADGDVPEIVDAEAIVAESMVVHTFPPVGMGAWAHGAPAFPEPRSSTPKPPRVASNAYAPRQYALPPKPPQPPAALKLVESPAQMRLRSRSRRRRRSDSRR